MREARLVALAAMCGACNAGESRVMTAEEVAQELRTVRVAPGLWQVSREVIDARGPNLPREAQARLKADRRSGRNCITPAQAARPEATFLRLQARGGGCTYRGFSMQSGRMRGTMTCTERGAPGTITTAMDGRHGPDFYDVRMHMTSTGMPEGANMTIDTRTRGRRIGECPPPAAPGRSIGGPP